MSRSVSVSLMAVAAVALLAAQASAKGHNDKHGHDTTAHRLHADTAGHRLHDVTAGHRLHATTAGRRLHDTTAVQRETFVVDRDGHRRIVTEYFDREGLPPGLARRRTLPPGLARQLRERGQLPPGLQRRLIVVPRPLAERLPPEPAYYRRYFAGRNLVVVDQRTNRIAAIIPNVLPG